MRSILAEKYPAFKIEVAEFSHHKGRLADMWVSTDLGHEQHRKYLNFIFELTYTENQK